MHHLAILDKKRKLLPKILSGEKTIESRWYRQKRAPWDIIKAGDIIFFKDSGEPVTAKAEVAQVQQFYLPHTDLSSLIQKYGKKIGFEEKNFPEILAWCQKRKYCILIHLQKVQKIEPFEINKKGYGMMAAWIPVENINQLSLL